MSSIALQKSRRRDRARPGVLGPCRRNRTDFPDGRAAWICAARILVMNIQLFAMVEALTTIRRRMAI